MSEAAVHARRAAIDEAVAAVRDRTDLAPGVAILWPYGLDALPAAVAAEAVIEGDALPHLAQGEPARLVLGILEGERVAVLQARLRRYDGHTLQQVVFPVRVLRALGAETLLVAADCTALAPTWAAGELMLVDDHINLLGDNPLVGPNLDDLGPRFPDMSVAYDPRLRQDAERTALAQRTVLRRGVYAALEGPSRATRAEYRMVRTLGADAVGTGMVAEVIAARHMAMRVLGLAVVVQVALPDALQPLGEDEVQAEMAAAEDRLTGLVRGVLAARES